MDDFYSRNGIDDVDPTWLSIPMTDEEVIVALGDSPKLAQLLGKPVSTVSNWKLRGISWPMRPHVRELARRRRLKLPEDFLTNKR